MEVRVAWETGLSPVSDCLEEVEAEEMLVSSSPLVRVPVIVTSDSDMKLDSYDFAPCKVLVVQSEHPEVVEKEEILLSSSSTDLAPRGSRTQLGARGLTGDIEGDSGRGWFS